MPEGVCESWKAPRQPEVLLRAGQYNSQKVNFVVSVVCQEPSCCVVRRMVPPLLINVKMETLFVQVISRHSSLDLSLKWDSPSPMDVSGCLPDVKQLALATDELATTGTFLTP